MLTELSCGEIEHGLSKPKRSKDFGRKTLKEIKAEKGIYKGKIDETPKKKESTFAKGKKNLL